MNTTILYDGTLYDLDSRRELRPGKAYYWQHREINTGRELRATLRASNAGPYAIAFICDDGCLLCPTCVRQELVSITDSIRHGLRDGWRVVGITSTGETDEDLTCEHCNSNI